MVPKGFDEEKVRLSAFDHRQLAQDYEKDANICFSSRAYDNALELFVKARDHYIVYGSSECMQRCQRHINLCLIQLGELDPRFYGIGHIDEEEKPRKRKMRKK